MYQKHKPLHTLPEIAAENKNNIISELYTTYWLYNNSFSGTISDIITMMMLTSYSQC